LKHIEFKSKGVGELRVEELRSWGVEELRS
jgi:hypothetical protein